MINIYKGHFELHIALLRGFLSPFFVAYIAKSPWIEEGNF